MAAAFGSVGTTLTYSSRTNSALAKPSGVSDGDTLLAFLFVGRSGSYLTPGVGTTGFTSAGTAPRQNDGSFYATYSCFKKVITSAGSEPSSYTFTHTSASSGGYIVRVSGSNGTINTFSTRAEKPLNTTRTWDSITPSVDGCYIAAAGFDWASTSNNLSPPSGYTERVDATVLYYCDLVQTTAAATGNISHTCNSANGGNEPRGGWLIALEPATGGGNKTLDANAGSYAIGGTAATLKYTRKVAANSGTYSVTGTAATLKRLLKTAANSGSYSITGQTASFARTWVAGANSGSYSISGTAANLEVHRQLAAASGSYSISGTTATLRMGKAIAAQSGTYSITGSNTGTLVSRKLVMGGATYSITGSDVTLTKSSDKVVKTDSGVYEITGSNASMSYSHRIMPVSSGSYAIGGYPVTLFVGVPVPRNSLNDKIRFGGAGSMADLARMGADIEVNFGTNTKIKEYGPHFWGDYAKQGGDVAE